ncbi:MAG: hypothetical protein IT439_10875 [Phycisphaerales bacterium]|nr:hypothetical protein [Phycisphaerales bacterium]
MRGCKVCPSTAIVGVMALAGLGWAGYTTVTGRCPLTGRCQTDTSAAALVSTETDAAPGGCCALTESTPAAPVMNASLTESADDCGTACEDACKTACEDAAPKKSGCCTDKPSAPIAADAPACPTGG